MEYPLYSPHEPTGIVIRPLVATVVLHIVIVALLTAKWVDQRQVSVKPRQLFKAIDARLVDASSLKPKQKPQTKPKSQKRAKPVPQKSVKKAQPRQMAKPKPAPKSVKSEVTKAEPVPKAQEPRLSAEELAAIARADLARAVESEEQVLQAATADQMSVSFQALIQQTVTRYWSRPPSARNGMEVLLALQLVPTGEVVSVSILKSSGDSAFDRSAVNAVNKAERFPELSSLPARVFERDFRRLRLLFKPEDLRY